MNHRIVLLEWNFCWATPTDKYHVPTGELPSLKPGDHVRVKPEHGSKEWKAVTIVQSHASTWSYVVDTGGRRNRTGIRHPGHWYSTTAPFWENADEKSSTSFWGLWRTYNHSREHKERSSNCPREIRGQRFSPIWNAQRQASQKASQTRFIAIQETTHDIESNRLYCLKNHNGERP